ncbi:MAG: HD domain-containing protein [Candidatus Odinarchaeum yellowstonii]|uniref:HD domain-containing protein n=1 Tax=Odinarchaeota yellowstonii (strain LCB_4) TaxID=1841599 RepID=A0AAF0D271_ODILC|nr:MAG: HD domain-containing protein [Candidatus Odinarchaeum yellowstonii]
MSDKLGTVVEAVNGVIESLHEKPVLADTRVKSVSLLDHLILTAGFAVAILKEILLRGRSPVEICGLKIEEGELLTLARIVGLLHDLGKDDEKHHEGHLERSVERVQALLSGKNLPDSYVKLVVDAVGRHHLSCNHRNLFEKIVCLSDFLASAGDRLELLRCESYEDITKINEGGFNLYQQIFEDQDGLCLISGDVDRVKDYVYESSRLPEIRGASELLNELNLNSIPEIFSKQLSKECLIYADGGGFLALSPIHLADTIIDMIQREYLDKSLTATITCVRSEPLSFFNFIYGLKPYSNKELAELNGEGVGRWLLESHFGKYSTPDKNEWFKERKTDSGGSRRCPVKGFGENVHALSSELRLKKSMKTTLPFFEAAPIALRCSSCGKRVASEKVIFSVEEEEYICRVCNLKRENGTGKKLLFREAFLRHLKLSQDEMEQAFSKFPENLDELAPEGEYMAYIYADGNETGSLLAEARSPTRYRSISNSLAKAVKNAVYTALSQIFGGKEGVVKNKLPFEIINIGGDDVSIIINSKFAFDFIIKFSEFFEESTKSLSEILELPPRRKITVSIGAVICKPKYPIYFVEKLASSLLKSAKKKAKELRESSNALIESTVNYLYFTNPIASESSEELLKEIYFNKSKSIYLTMRPFTLSEFKFLIEKSREFAGIFNSTQRNMLKRVLYQGKLQSANFLFYQLARLKDDINKARDLLKLIGKKFNCDDIGWRSSDSGMQTPLMDLLEIIDIEGESGESTAS